MSQAVTLPTDVAAYQDWVGHFQAQIGSMTAAEIAVYAAAMKAVLAELGEH